MSSIEEQRRTQEIKEHIRKEDRLRQYRYQQKWFEALPNPSRELENLQEQELDKAITEETAQLARSYWLISDLLLGDRSEGSNTVGITLPYPYRDKEDAGMWENVSRILDSHLPPIEWNIPSGDVTFSEDYSHRLPRDEETAETIQIILRKQSENMHVSLNSKETHGYIIISPEGDVTTIQDYKHENTSQHRNGAMRELVYLLKISLELDEDGESEAQFASIKEDEGESETEGRIIVLFPDRVSE